MAQPETKNSAEMVSVYDFSNKQLLKSSDVRLIQLRDDEGNLMALLCKMTKNAWGFCAKGDSDWESFKKNLEIKD